MMFSKLLKDKIIGYVDRPYYLVCYIWLGYHDGESSESSHILGDHGKVMLLTRDEEYAYLEASGRKNCCYKKIKILKIRLGLRFELDIKTKNRLKSRIITNQKRLYLIERLKRDIYSSSIFGRSNSKYSYVLSPENIPQNSKFIRDIDSMDIIESPKETKDSDFLRDIDTGEITEHPKNLYCVKELLLE